MPLLHPIYRATSIKIVPILLNELETP